MHRTTADFWEAYSALPEDIRRRADKQFGLLKESPRHASRSYCDFSSLVRSPQLRNPNPIAARGS
jgi:hypothetical protein